MDVATRGFRYRVEAARPSSVIAVRGATHARCRDRSAVGSRSSRGAALPLRHLAPHLLPQHRTTLWLISWPDVDPLRKNDPRVRISRLCARWPIAVRGRRGRPARYPLSPSASAAGRPSVGGAQSQAFRFYLPYGRRRGPAGFRSAYRSERLGLSRIAHAASPPARRRFSSMNRAPVARKASRRDRSP